MRKKCKVITALGQQSPDIKAGVDVALESRSEGSNRLGAGDQGMMIGYATNESKDYMPLPISISHTLTRKLSEVRKNGTLEWVRPDVSNCLNEHSLNGLNEIKYNHRNTFTQLY